MAAMSVAPTPVAKARRPQGAGVGVGAHHHLAGPDDPFGHHLVADAGPDITEGDPLFPGKQPQLPLEPGGGGGVGRGDVVEDQVRALRPADPRAAHLAEGLVGKDAGPIMGHGPVHPHVHVRTGPGTQDLLGESRHPVTHPLDRFPDQLHQHFRGDAALVLAAHLHLVQHMAELGLGEVVTESAHDVLQGLSSRVLAEDELALPAHEGRRDVLVGEGVLQDGGDMDAALVGKGMLAHHGLGLGEGDPE